MSDKPVAILTTILIGAPLMVVCCGGGIAALVALVGGLAGLFSGFGLIAALVMALVGLTISSVIRHKRLMSRKKTVEETQVRHTNNFVVEPSELSDCANAGINNGWTAFASLLNLPDSKKHR
ncbi:MAG: hypothetical protein JKY44_04525 [Flavobacteriaceae bacterium]|nr:hypothetical protein [Flavobacteriaceae bacterium]